MLFARSPAGDVLIGLTEENLERMRSGMPAVVRPQTHPGATHNITVMHGHTEADIVEELRAKDLLLPQWKEHPGSEKIYRPLVSQYRHEAPGGKVLILTCGLPRSGKSTWARKQAWPVVCPDAIRLALHGQAFYAPAEQMVWAHARLMVRSLFGAGHATVILDATNVTKARRQEWAGKEWLSCVKEMTAPKEECLTRARVEGRDDLAAVIERMAAAYEAPGPEERPWP